MYVEVFFNFCFSQDMGDFVQDLAMYGKKTHKSVMMAAHSIVNLVRFKAIAIHTYIHTYIHLYIHVVYKHTYMHTHTHAHIFIHAFIHTYIYILTYTYAYIHTNKQTLSSMYPISNVKGGIPGASTKRRSRKET